MADYTNSRTNSLPDPASPGFRDGDTISLQNGSRFSRQNGRWEPIAFQSGSAESPLTVRNSAQGLVPSVAIRAANTTPLLIPPTLYGVVALENNIYYESISPDAAGAEPGAKPASTAYEHDVSAAVSGLQIQAERITWTPTVAGTTAARISQIDPLLGRETAGVDVSFVFAAAAAKNGALDSVLPIGDSMTDAGTITQTLLDQGASGAPYITTVGTRGTGPNFHEGRGGWKLSDYLGFGVQWYQFTCAAITTVPAYGALYTNNGATYAVQSVSGGGTVNNVGTDLLTNGDFSAGAASWTLLGAVSIAGGKCDLTSATNDILSQSVTVTAATQYELTLTITDYKRGAPYVALGQGTPVYLPKYNGTHKIALTCGATDTIMRFYPGNPGTGGSCKIDNVTLKQITGTTPSTAGTILCSKVSGGLPSASGTLTKSSGTGDATIAFASYAAVSGNPFWNAGTGTASFANYFANTGQPVPSRCLIQLGTNDVSTLTTDAAVTAAIDVLLPAYDAWVSEGAALGIKMGVVPPLPPSGNQDAWGFKYGTAIKRWRFKRNWAMLVRALIARFAGREAQGIYVVPSYLSIDPIYGYSYGAAANVNARSTVQVARGNDALHPATAGYQQVGDAEYAWIKAT